MKEVYEGRNLVNSRRGSLLVTEGVTTGLKASVSVYGTRSYFGGAKTLGDEIWSIF